MAAEGMPFPWRGNGSRIYLHLGAVREMSDEPSGDCRVEGPGAGKRVQHFLSDRPLGIAKQTNEEPNNQM